MPIRIYLSIIALLATLPLDYLGAQDTNQMKLLFEEDGLSGWVEMGKQGVYRVESGVLTAENPGNYPSWLRSVNEYENFVLKLQYKMPGWCEAGLLLHAPLYGRPSRAGLKIHLRHNDLDEGARSVGSIYDVLAPMVRNPEGRNKWNSLEATVDWPFLKTLHNGTLIHEVNMESLPELKWRLRKGYLGFQDLDCRIQYRDVQIKELPGKEVWTPLFRGTDFGGSSQRGDAVWTWEDESVVASNGDGYLITEDDFSHFEFQTYVRTSPHANGGVFYRWESRSDRGYECQIYNVPEATNPTGSIYQRVPAQDSETRDKEWFLLQIISDGPYSAILLDGRIVAESQDLEKPDRGKIALQMHSEGEIRFYRPRIKSLR